MYRITFVHTCEHFLFVLTRLLCACSVLLQLLDVMLLVFRRFFDSFYRAWCALAGFCFALLFGCSSAISSRVRTRFARGYHCFAAQLAAHSRQQKCLFYTVHYMFEWFTFPRVPTPPKAGHSKGQLLFILTVACVCVYGSDKNTPRTLHSARIEPSPRPYSKPNGTNTSADTNANAHEEILIVSYTLFACPNELFGRILCA